MTVTINAIYVNNNPSRHEDVLSIDLLPYHLVGVCTHSTTRTIKGSTIYVQDEQGDDDKPDVESRGQ
jgi:hypothetical protein